MATVRQHKRRHPSAEAGTCSGASAAHCQCTPAPPWPLYQPEPASQTGAPLLRAEPLARTDSWVTSTVKSQHISSVGFSPKSRHFCPLHRLRSGPDLPPAFAELADQGPP
jgi:hypothetical protein